MYSSPAATFPDSPDYPESCKEVGRLCPDYPMVGVLSTLTSWR